MGQPLVSDALWAVVEPLIPPEPAKPKGGHPRVPDRAALTDILFVLRSGIPWEMLLSEMGCGSGMTCWRRLRDWQEAGIWTTLQRVLLDRLGKRNAIDFRRAALDSASVAAKRGRGHRPEPDRSGKAGSKRHVLTDANGIPLVLTLTEANVHDDRVLEEVVDAVPPIRQSWGPP
jgi:transposase